MKHCRTGWIPGLVIWLAVASAPSNAACPSTLLFSGGAVSAPTLSDALSTLPPELSEWADAFPEHPVRATYFTDPQEASDFLRRVRDKLPGLIASGFHPIGITGAATTGLAVPLLLAAGMEGSGLAPGLVCAVFGPAMMVFDWFYCAEPEVYEGQPQSRRAIREEIDEHLAYWGHSRPGARTVTWDLNPYLKIRVKTRVVVMTFLGTDSKPRTIVAVYVGK